MKLFIPGKEAGRLEHKRLNEELEKQRLSRERRAAAGAAGNAVRWAASQCDPNAVAKRRSSSPTPSPTPVKKYTPTPFSVPTADEAAAYADEIGLPQDQRIAFLDNKTSNGWMVGRNKVKDWRACMRTWHRNWKSGMFGGNGHAAQSKLPFEAKMTADAAARGLMKPNVLNRPKILNPSQNGT
jgi:hypothetical protein